MNRELVEMPVQTELPKPAPGRLAQRLAQCAFLLDIDGTLLDLAPTPREVWVPPGLGETLDSCFREGPARSRSSAADR